MTDEPVWDRVIARMRARDAAGRTAYGAPLTARTPRDHLLDAIEEVLDLSAYLEAELARRDAAHAHLTALIDAMNLNPPAAPEWPELVRTVRELTAGAAVKGEPMSATMNPTAFAVGDRVEIPIYNRPDLRFGRVIGRAEAAAGVWYEVRRDDGQVLHLDAAEIRAVEPRVCVMVDRAGAVVGVRANYQNVKYEVLGDEECARTEYPFDATPDPR